MAYESLPEQNSTTNPDNVIEPNGLPKWENDILGASEADRMRQAAPPMSPEDVIVLKNYCYEPQPNGKSAFENDMLEISESDRHIPLIQ